MAIILIKWRIKFSHLYLVRIQYMQLCSFVWLFAMVFEVNWVVWVVFDLNKDLNSNCWTTSFLASRRTWIKYAWVKWKLEWTKCAGFYYVWFFFYISHNIWEFLNIFEIFMYIIIYCIFTTNWMMIHGITSLLTTLLFCTIFAKLRY